MTTRRHLLRGLAASGTLLAPSFAGGMGTARAEEAWPSRPVNVVVPFGAGGSTDAFARVVLQRLGADLGRPFTVDNRNGANGTIGANAVARARPDGYTLLITTITSYAMAPHLIQVPYDNARAFASAGLVANMPMLLMVGRNHPARSLQEYVALARARQGKEIFANPAVGSSAHLAAELFFQQARLEVHDVVYRATAPAAQAVISGEAGMTVAASSAVMGLVRDGELRVLAVAAPHRVALLPDVPTFEEAGFPGVVINEDIALLAPAGTPESILDRINATMAAAMKAPEVSERLTALGVEPGVRPRAEWPAYFEREYTRWGELIRAKNIRIQ
ncbi:tripartite tricarboxylate transporter substrate binding protein [Roseomonas sp. GC11]|uniref:Bug family tripartite tricarboxylate transporter substrate binding protein n=1 Tax=Roseomonas sp. GC11 TaxID=2950546 RepID=UPI00210DEB91|nr:tripartite tricarboxylate transporter substrate binding protein [Roseomonas sp. GC11]MCQ4159272.1 tripartite tricarboxylate transporter substrate binding protein [Roseomonas sp. GC11]